jgi:hypothetical protein
MPTNPYITNFENNVQEQKLLNSLTKEAIAFNGLNCYYIIRDDGTNNENIDPIFQENPSVSYSKVLYIEMYLDTPTGFIGPGELFSRFGWEVRDETFFTIARDRFNEEAFAAGITNRPRPYEADIIYIPLTNDFFKIEYVDQRKEQFYQLGEYYRYVMTCNKLVYSSEVFNTGIPAIDAINQRAQSTTINNPPNVAQFINTIAEPVAINSELQTNTNAVLNTQTTNPAGSVG